MTDYHAIFQNLELLRQRGDGKWSARCPAHDDRGPSLSIELADDRILLHCFAGCQVESICEALGCRVGDLFLNELTPQERARVRYVKNRAQVLREVRMETTVMALLQDTATPSQADRERGALATRRLAAAAKILGPHVVKEAFRE